MPYPPITNPASVGVIVGRDFIGDALIKLPFLRAMRTAWPDAEINWITSQGPTAYNDQLREVTRHLIDRVYEQPKWMTQADAPAPRFSILMDSRNRWKMALAARRGIPHDEFIAPAFRFLLSDRRPSPFASRPAHMVDRMLQMVELAVGYIPPSTGSLPVADAVIAKARRIMPAGQTYVGFAPGAGNMVKAWPRGNFEQIAARQAAKGRVPVFLLGPQELDWREVLSAAIPPAIFPLQDNDAWGGDAITVERTLAVGGLLEVAVANDSGTGHMLAAADCPLISLFGPTSPDKLAPKVSRGKVIKAQDYGDSSTRAIPCEVVDAAIDDMIRRL